MKVCIIGAGAIGGFIGTKLGASTSAEISVLARGATLAALREKGMRLIAATGVAHTAVRASDHAAELGVQDLIVIAVKGHSLTSVALDIAPLLGADTVVMPAMNGVPWWFCDGLPGFETPLGSIDPGGVIAAAIPLKHVVGCVIHANASVVEPATVQHHIGRKLTIGEPHAKASERVRQIADLLMSAGFDVTQSQNIRYDIWYKLWGNLTNNPISAMTGATTDRILDDDLVREFCSSVMREAAQVGRSIGCPIDQSPDDRHAVTRRLGAFKTSMLQDAEAGRQLELDAIVTVVHEIAMRQQINTPSIDALLGLARLFGKQHGLYGAN